MSFEVSFVNAILLNGVEPFEQIVKIPSTEDAM